MHRTGAGAGKELVLVKSWCWSKAGAAGKKLVLVMKKCKKACAAVAAVHQQQMASLTLKKFGI